MEHKDLYNNILDYKQAEEKMNNISKNKIFTEVEDLGKTEYGLPIRHFLAGTGNSDIVITGATHGSEIITTDFIIKLMQDIEEKPKEWENILTNFKVHLIPILNPEGYLISTSAIRKLIPREMSMETAEKICKEYYLAYKKDDMVDSIKKEHMAFFNNIDYTCIPDEYISIKKNIKEIFEKYPDLPRECLHIWSANANGIDIQANSKYNPKISRILKDEDIYMPNKRHDNLMISHPGPINCPFDKEKGFKLEKETLAINNLLDRLQKKGKLFAYLNYHSTGGLIFQRPSIPPEDMEVEKSVILRKNIVNYMFSKAYQDKTYKNTGIDEKGKNKKENSKYIIYTKESQSTSSNDIFRLIYPKDLLIELSGMGGNPIAPYADISGNYKNAINSNLEAVKYTLNVASIAQMISDATYQVIEKIDSDVKYDKLIAVQDMIYKEFSKRIENLQNIEKEEDYDR